MANQPIESDFASRIEAFQAQYSTITAELGKVIVGHADVVEDVLVCLFCGGNVLLEGVPGLGKTLLVRTLSDALNLSFGRIQFTPDLMPADIVGTNMVVENKETGQRSIRRRGKTRGAARGSRAAIIEGLLITEILGEDLGRRAPRPRLGAAS